METLAPKKSCLFTRNPLYILVAGAVLQDHERLAAGNTFNKFYFWFNYFF